MRYFLPVLFLFFSSSFSNENYHEFYVTTTNVVIKEEKKALQITCQLFIDDIELLLKQNNPELTLYPDSDEKKIDLLLEETFKKVFRIKLDQEWVKHKFIGREYKSDILQCYIEIEILELPKIMSIQNTIFFNLFQDQQNILHFKNGTKRKSFLLHSSKNMVSFPVD